MQTDGLLVLDKPRGMTSRDAVDRALRWFPRRTKVGHTGTLDPLATGVLVLCVGSATRLVEYVQRMSKAYRSTFRLGARSDSDDGDGVVVPTPGATDPGREAVERALAGLVGTLRQVPPAFSAAHVEGQRAYDRARRGEEVKLEPRPVEVYSIAIERYAYPEVEVIVQCGKGTYIRSLARDLGAALGQGAYVQALRRTRVGPFTAQQAVPLDAKPEEVRLLPSALALAELPLVEVTPEAARRLRMGQAVPHHAPDTVEVAVFEGDAIVGIGNVASGSLRPLKILPGS